MRGWLLFAALAVATPALAVPPILPKTDVVEQFMAAMKANDSRAYSRLFAPEATITRNGETFDRAQWLERAKGEFTTSRETRFFTGLAGPGHFVIVEAVKDCGGPPRPGVPSPVECFSSYRLETLTLTADATQIQTLERSDFHHALSPEGEPLLFID